MSQEPVRVGGCELWRGDCRDVLPFISGVDAVITDPPYSSGGFQEAGKSGGSLGTRGKQQIQMDNLSTRGYIRLMRAVLSRTDADEFFIFTDWRMWTYTYDAMEDAGIRVRNMLVWDKGQMGMGLPWRNQHELIAYGKRTPASNVTGKFGNVLRCARTGNEHHPTEKPAPLMRAFLDNSRARTVLDPFMGSGTTGVVCAEACRRFIGIERDPTHFATAERRIREALAAPPLPGLLARPEEERDAPTLF